MVDASKNLYCPGMTPQALATKVLNDRFREGMPSLPIDPFKLMREYGIVYQLMEFENLDGDYENLNKRISHYRPDRKKLALGIEIEDISLLRQEIDSYVFFFSLEPDIVWYKFKNDFIYGQMTK